VFDHLRADAAHGSSHLLDIYTYTTAISVCSGSQQLERALELATEMRARGVARNVHTYSALMNVAVKSSDVSFARRVYREMLDDGCAPNLVTFNTLVDLYVKTGQWRDAVGVLDALEQHVRPARVVCVVLVISPLLTVCCRSERIPRQPKLC
jgi:pentatricopeptide repeat domain-containing protein 1